MNEPQTLVERVLPILESYDEDLADYDAWIQQLRATRLSLYTLTESERRRLELLEVAQQLRDLEEAQ
jgi:hypothetical protein